MIKFSWDERKRLANARKHGIDFRDLPQVFSGFTLTLEDLRYHYDERRFVTIGLLKQVVLLIAHTESPEVIRIIHARKASKETAERYFRELAKHASDHCFGNKRGRRRGY